jgi:NAD+-dependent protein deacetylase SIR2
MGLADLLIVIGTSLTVHPFASLTNKVEQSCPRVLINIEKVGDFGHRKNDVVLLGKCDDIIRVLCAELGWAEELEKAWAETAEAVEETGEGVSVKGKDKEHEDQHEAGEKDMKKEVDLLTAAIEAHLVMQENAKEEKEETQSIVIERENKDADHGSVLDLPSEPSRQTAAADTQDQQSDSKQETSTSDTNPDASEAKGTTDRS